jgi:serine/threonine-protein phosphatase PGAM5
MSIAVLATLTASVTASASAADAAASGFSRTLYLVRHGAYKIDEKTDLDAGPGLTPLGIAQARLIAARLRTLPVHFSLMTSSTMTRAKETAEVMHETLSDVPLAESPSLAECTPPMSNERVVKEAAADEATRCQEQLEDVFKTYFVPAKNADEHDIIVAHGNVIRFLVLKALRVDTQSWTGLSVAHTSLTIIRITPQGRIIVLSVGDVGHIPPNMQSGATGPDPQLVLPH